MATFNQVTFIGRLGKDPEMSYTPNGKPVTKFSMAVDQGKDAQGKDVKPMWLNITCWNDLAERMNTWLHKGLLVLVQGRLQTRMYTDKSNVERLAIDVIASTVHLLERKETEAALPPAADADDEKVPF